MALDTGSRLIVALDFSQVDDCLNLVGQLDPQCCRLKVGKELFTIGGPALVERLVGLNFDVFLDLKFHDIPNTVSKAVTAAAQMGVWMVNVHASGGRRMLEAAREAVDGIGGHKPLLIAVTVLTSLTEEDLPQLGVAGSLQEQVLRLAELSQVSGLDGVVCSAREASLLKKKLGKDFLLVTPGIRPNTNGGTSENVNAASSDDQRRVMTPEQALSVGCDYLVVGRPITAAADPASACKLISDIVASHA